MDAPFITPGQVPIGIYVHIPFCRRHCTYCPFAVSTRRDAEERTIDALLREIEMRGDGSLPADSLFLGGGTPSLTSVPNLARVFAAIRSKFVLHANAETTIEANPEDVTPENVTAWLEMGVNRISVGVQSLHDSELRPLGRVHSRDLALAALETAGHSGARVSADLIVGLPRQTPGSFRETLDLVLASGVGHLSVYMLDLEEGTMLQRQAFAGKVSIGSDDDVQEMYFWTIEQAARHGLEQYEISNFARPGERSLHNLKYWKREPYLGLGVSAHSFDGAVRFANERDVDAYIARIGSGGDAVVFRETLSDEEERHERLLLALRQTAGLRYADLLELSGEEGAQWACRGFEEGWLHRDETHVAFTPRGFLLSNEYISQLF
jgi:putative oxygen-independent coproporphyrinogen III oxidase